MNVHDGERSPVSDFMSMYMSKSKTPAHKTNGSFISQLQFSPSPSKLQNENNTSRSENIEQSVAYLNQEVTVLGFPSLYDGASEKYSIARLVNCASELLRKHQRSSRIRQDLENSKHRLESDLDQQQQKYARLLCSMEQCERERAQAMEKERQLFKKNKLLISKLKAEKEEVKRLHSVIQHQETQNKHEVKKRERELNKLKERLHQQLHDKNKEQHRIGMDILNVVHRTDGKRGTWKTGNRQEEEMYRQMISNYEDRQKDLRLENAELRKTLGVLHEELASVLDQPGCSDELHDSKSRLLIASGQACSDDDIDDELDSMTSHSPDDLSQGVFQMPYEQVQEEVERNLKEKCRQLKQHMRRLEKQNGGSMETVKPVTQNKPDDRHKKDIDKLNKQIQRYREIIEQQEQLIQQGFQSQEENMDKSILGTSESALWEEKQALEEERSRFAYQKANFDEERRIYTEAAVRLAREYVDNEDWKTHMDVRKAFEEEKVAFIQEHYLQMTPFNNPGKRVRPKTSPSPNNKILDSVSMPSSRPVFSPSPRGRQLPETPTTVDLYRTLGLTHSQDQERTSPQLKIADTNEEAKASKSRESSRNSSCHTTPTSSLNTSPGNQARLAEHMENIRLALFQKHGSPSGITSPGDQTEDGTRNT